MHAGGRIKRANGGRNPVDTMLTTHVVDQELHIILHSVLRKSGAGWVCKVLQGIAGHCRPFTAEYCAGPIILQGGLEMRGKGGIIAPGF